MSSKTALSQVLSTETKRSPKGILIVYFQRGGADGLHMVAPYRDKRYRSLRGALTLDEPGRANGLLDLGDGFGFHPAMEPLYSLYKQRRLAIVHAVGSPDPTRSHFDAQDYMELGTPGVKSTRDGWLTRALRSIEETDDERSPFTAIALTSSMPRSLASAADALAMEDFSKLGTRRRNASMAERIYEMYRQDPNPDFANAGEEALRAVELFRDKAPLSVPTRKGITYPPGRRARTFRQLAQLIKADLGIRIAFLESGGWDTHFNQGSAKGQTANLLRELGASISAFFKDLGPDAPITLLTMTEFGRTAAINGAGGTDHGHGTAMMVMGQGVRGGKVWGDWPGLGKTNLYMGRDLAVTTDFRDLFAEVATSALGLSNDTQLFPGYRSKDRPGAMTTAD
jgi:uncharacterized protein (DUF1501 family)